MANDLQRTVDILIRVSKQGTEVFKKVESDVNALYKSLQNLTGAIKSLDGSFDQMGASAKAAGNQVADAMKKGSGSVVDLDQKTKDSLAGTLTWASAFWKVHSALLAIKAISLPISIFAEFERKMSEVQAVSQASEEDMVRLEQAARSLGETTEFTATQVAQGFKDLSEAGFDTEQMLAAIGPVLKIAHIGILEMGEAADIVANIMSGFGIAAEEITTVVDEIAYVTTRSNATVRELGESMKYVGPVATAAGLDFTEVVSALGMLHDAGIKGSMAGTTLRGVLSRLLSPTKEEAELMKELSRSVGKTATDLVFAGGKMRPLADIIKDLEDAGIRAGEAMELFGDRAGPGMAALLMKGSRSLREMKEAAERAQGIADQMSKTIGANLKGAMEELTGAVEELILSLWDNNRTLEDIVRNTADAVRSIKDFVKENRDLIDTILAVGAAVGGLVLTLLSLNAVFSVGGLAIGTVTKGMALLSTTAGILTKYFGAGGLVTAVTTLWKSLGSLLGTMTLWVGVAVVTYNIAYKLGQQLNELSVGYLKVGEWAQIGFARVMEAYDWLRGVHDSVYTQVIADIKKEAATRTFNAKVIAANADKEKQISKERSEITKKFMDQLRELSKVWTKTDADSKLAINNYKTAFQAASSYAEEFAKVSIASAEAVWAAMSSQQGADSMRQTYLALETATMEYATQRESILAESETRSAIMSTYIMQDALKKQMELIGAAEDSRKTILNERRDYELKMAEATFTDAKLLAERKKVIEENFVRDVNNLEAELFSTRIKYYSQAADKFRQGIQQSLASIEASYKRIAELEQQQKDFTASVEEAKRQEARKTMSESEKFEDDKKKWAKDNEALRKAIASGEEAAIVRAMKLIEDSGRRYQDMNKARLQGGKEVISQVEAEAAAQKLLADSQRAYKEAGEALKRIEEENIARKQEQAKNEQLALDQILAKEKLITAERAANSNIVLKIERKMYDDQMAEVTKAKEVSVEAKLKFTQADVELTALTTKIDNLKKLAEINITAKFADEVSKANIERLTSLADMLGEGFKTEIDMTDKVTPQVQAILEQIQSLDAMITGEDEEGKRTYMVNFKGTNAGDEEGLTEKITTIEGKISELDGYLGIENIRNYTIAFVTPEGVGISEYLLALKTQLDEFMLSLSPEGGATNQILISFMGNVTGEDQPLGVGLQTIVDLMGQFQKIMSEIETDFLISFLGDAAGEAKPLEKTAAIVVKIIEELVDLLKEEYEFIISVEKALDSLKSVKDEYASTKNYIEGSPIVLNIDVSSAINSLAEVRRKVDDLRSYIESHPIVQVVKTEMSGSTTRPFSEKLVELTNKFLKFRNLLTDPTSFRVDITSGGEGISSVLENTKKQLQDISKTENDLVGSTNKLLENIQAPTSSDALSATEEWLEAIYNRVGVVATEVEQSSFRIITEIEHVGGKITDLLRGAVIDMSGGGKDFLPFDIKFPEPKIIEPTTPLEIILVEIRYKLGELVFYMKVFTTEFKAMMAELIKIYSSAGGQIFDLSRSTGGAIAPRDEPVRLAIMQSAEYLSRIKDVLVQGFQNIGAIPFPDDVNYIPPYVSGETGIGTAATGPRVVVDFNFGNGNVYSGIFKESDAMNMVEQLQRAQESAL